MKLMTAFVRGTILHDFRRVALSLDLDPVALIERAGIDRRNLDNPELALPAHRLVELLELAALTSGTDDFGLRLGELRGVPDFGPAILMLPNLSTMRSAAIPSPWQLNGKGVCQHDRRVAKQDLPSTVGAGLHLLRARKLKIKAARCCELDCREKASGIDKSTRNWNPFWNQRPS